MAELQLEYYYQNASIANATVHIPLGHSVSKQQLHLWACWLDLASVLLYLVVVFFIILYQQRVLEEVASKTVTVVDYSVQVWDLPKVGLIVTPDAGDLELFVHAHKHQCRVTMLAGAQFAYVWHMFETERCHAQNIVTAADKLQNIQLLQKLPMNLAR